MKDIKHIVAATPGYRLIAVTEGDPPYEIYTTPIVAWAITEYDDGKESRLDAPEPIGMEPMDTEAVLEISSGYVYLLADRMFINQHEYRHHVLSERAKKATK